MQRRENHATHRRLASFSPLLIGEIGATMPGLATPQMLIWLVSVPSSSGRSVQLSFWFVPWFVPLAGN